MDLRPVHTLTAEEAVLELEQLCDNPPAHSKDKPTWQSRIDALNAWLLLQNAPKAPEAAAPQAAEPDFVQEKLQEIRQLVGKDSREDRARLSKLRYDVRKHCLSMNLPIPPRRPCSSPTSPPRPGVPVRIDQSIRGLFPEPWPRPRNRS